MTGRLVDDPEGDAVPSAFSRRQVENGIQKSGSFKPVVNVGASTPRASSQTDNFGILTPEFCFPFSVFRFPNFAQADTPDQTPPERD